MTNLPQQDTIKQYYGDGVTDDYSVPFYTPVEPDGNPNLTVYVTLQGETPIPEDDIKTYGVDYTFAALPNPIDGGTVTFLPGKIPPNLSIVTLVQAVQFSLDVNFSDARNFNGANLDAALDKLLLMAQQLRSYVFERNLSYVINALQPDLNITANTQLPQLLENQIWMGQGDAVIAVTLEENPDVSTLRSELANNSPGTDGAQLVGYYDIYNNVATNVRAFLNNLPAFTNAHTVNTQTYEDTSSTPGDVEITIPSSYTAYVDGTYVRVLIAAANPSVATINVNGIGALPIHRPGGQSIFTGDMVAGMVAEFVLYSDHAMMLNPQTGFANKWYGAAVFATNSSIPPGNSPVVLNWTGIDANPYGFYGANRMTPNIIGGGYFLVTCSIMLPAANNNNQAVQLFLRKNGSLTQMLDMQILFPFDDIVLSGSTIIQANGTTDYFEILASNFGIATLNLTPSESNSRWSMTLLGQ